MQWFDLSFMVCLMRNCQFFQKWKSACQTLPDESVATLERSDIRYIHTYNSTISNHGKVFRGLDNGWFFQLVPTFWRKPAGIIKYAGTIKCLSVAYHYLRIPEWSVFQYAPPTWEMRAKDFLSKLILERKLASEPDQSRSLDSALKLQRNSSCSVKHSNSSE